MSITLDKTQRIYEHLSDDTSRFLFEKRCMWSLTGDRRYVDDIIWSLIDRERADLMMEKAAEVSERLVIRGIGNEYRTLRHFYPELEFECFVDRDPVKVAQGMIDGHRIISTDEFYGGHSDHYVLVNSSAFCEEIEEELIANGVPEERILNFGKLCLSGEQYFEPGIIIPQDNEVFVDGGCYDGTTFRRFIRWCGGRYDKIFSFEPDHYNHELTKRSLEREPVRGLTLYERGLWDKAETLRFNASGGQGSFVTDSEEGTTSIETASIDETVGDTPVTFIKLDVEGAELKALEGAERTITGNHPRLAISIYHKPEDIFELPERILSFSEDYRFYLRHYQMSEFETILYAV